MLNTKAEEIFPILRQQWQQHFIAFMDNRHVLAAHPVLFAALGWTPLIESYVTLLKPVPDQGTANRLVILCCTFTGWSEAAMVFPAGHAAC